MDTYRNGLILAALTLLCAQANAQSFMECADIEDDANRLNCYDTAAAAIKTSMQKPQAGSSEQRQEQRNAEVAAIVFGEEQAPEIIEEVPEQITFIIKTYIFNHYFFVFKSTHHNCITNFNWKINFFNWFLS